MPSGIAYRVCRHCGTEYRASRPACPGCGSTPFTRRHAFASAGPRIAVLICGLFFLAMLVYSAVLPSAYYEKYRGFFFWMPRWASILFGAAGAALSLLAAARQRAGARGRRE